MTDYTPNSHRFKEEQREATKEKKIEPVVSTPVKIKKKSEARKFADIFISEDVSNVKSYIFMDVLVPAIKKAVSDIVTDGIDMILYGSAGKSRKSSSASKVSYSSYYDRDRRDYHRDEPRTRHNFDDIIFAHRHEAEEVLSRMDEIIDEYKIVSVADMYDLAGVSCDYTAHKYGWTNLRNAAVVRLRDGYKIDLPKALPID